MERTDTTSPPSTEGMACTLSSTQPDNSLNFTKKIDCQQKQLNSYKLEKHF